MVSGIGIILSILVTLPTLTPDTSSADSLAADRTQFIVGMLLIFLFAGIGNASTFKQMPMIFPPRQAGGVIGWTAAIAAYGPFFFGLGLVLVGPVPFYLTGIAFAAVCLVITWVRYARPGAPRPS
jgi:NNP family nitrate/nitrite transporter-like MFS transporter